jgi:hypothetical protein
MSRRTRFLPAAIAVLSVLVAGCSGDGPPGTEEAGDPVASSSPAVGQVEAVAPCSGSKPVNTCMVVTNRSWGFIGPNQVARAAGPTMSYVRTDIESGGWNQAPPRTIGPEQQVRWMFESIGWLTGAIVTVYYEPPGGVFPAGELVGFFGSIPYGGSNSWQCRDSNFFRCGVVSAPPSGRTATGEYTFTNRPVVVRVTNNLQAPLERQGAPTLANLVLDPVAGENATVPAGRAGAPSVAYVGGFRSYTAQPAYSATFQVGPGETNISGSRAVIDARMDPSTGADGGSVCNVQAASSTGPQLRCSVKVTGPADGTVTVDIQLNR